MGAPPGPLVPTATGAEFLVRYPTWPPGYTGCLTHCDGYRAAAVAGATFTAGWRQDPPEAAAPTRPAVLGRWAVGGTLSEGHIATSVVIR
jgi:hypothetical protein